MNCTLPVNPWLGPAASAHLESKHAMQRNACSRKVLEPYSPTRAHRVSTAWTEFMQITPVTDCGHPAEGTICFLPDSCADESKPRGNTARDADPVTGSFRTPHPSPASTPCYLV